MDYLFHSNYPYFEALHLGRYLQSLSKMDFQLLAGSCPTQQHCHGFLQRLSSPQVYRMKPSGFKLAKAGILRALEASVIKESVADELSDQLDRWARESAAGTAW